ncbi:response regulator [Planktothrix mougeotii]|uniref:histidine kinase n=1 Tax=Planktothrix mougeotii LEGE 06226 TaxID=1828728 RepID=A0ABR9U7X0_9CYAN|nr:response regulator [Planktothrix mougeotii]MBE9142554.1 PAS domain S-box protein [Planktothrix mougeotii LEGE 06226]
MKAEYQAVNILIIDDSPINLKYLGKLLSLQGYQVQLANSGELGLKVARETLPDVIILDIMMPGLDGYEVCQRLKVDLTTQHIPVIFVSVIEEVSEKVKAFQIGAADYLTKPLQKDEILARIHHQLTIQSLHRQLKAQNLQLRAEITTRQQLEEKFTKAFFNSPNPISLMTYDEGYFLDVNPSFLKTFGYEEFEVIGQTAIELNLWVNPEDESQLKQYLQQGNSIHNQMIQQRTKAGQIKTLLLSAELIALEEKTCILSIINDITEQELAQQDRQEAEEALRKSEKKYRNLVETSQDIIWSANLKGCYTFVNPAVKTILEYEPEEVMGRLFSHFVPLTQVSYVQKVFQPVLAGQALVRHHLINVSKSGKWVHLLVNAFPVYNAQGDVIGITGTASDITEQKTTERALQMIVEGTASKTGQEFFRSCVYYLAEVLQVRYVGVFKLLKTAPPQLANLAFWDGEKWSDRWLYDLIGTPCEQVIKMAQSCHFSENVQILFPDDQDLTELQAQSYWGIPLFNSDHDIIGILIVIDIHNKQLNVSQESLLKIFADRAGAELERQLAEELLEYRSRMDHLLSDISRLFINETLENTIRSTLQEIAQFLQCDWTFIFNCNSPHTPWNITAQWWLNEPQNGTHSNPVLSVQTLPWIHQQLQSKRTEILAIANLDECPDLSPQDLKTLRCIGCQSLIFIPLMKSGKTKGFMGIINFHSIEGWTIETQNWLKLIGELIAIRQTTQETQQALEKSKTRYQNLADNIPGVIYQFMLHPDGSMSLPYISSGCWDLYEISPSQAMIDVHQLFAKVHREDLQGVLNSICDSAEYLSPWTYTWRIITASSQIKWLQANARPEPQADGSILWDGLIIDITQNKQAETVLRETAQRQQTLARMIGRMRQTLDADTIFSTTTQELRYELNSDRVGIYQFNTDGRGQFVAESLVSGCQSLLYQSIHDPDFDPTILEPENCVLLSLNQEDRVQDTYLRDIQEGVHRDGLSYLCIDDIYQAGFPDCYLQLLERMQVKSYLIVPIFCQTVSTATSSLVSSRLKLWGLLAVYQHFNSRQWQESEINLVVQIGSQLGVALQQVALLTHTQQQSEELCQAKEAADAANRAKSEFLANMSHELRTPLNAILGFTQLMNRDSSLSYEQQEQIKIIHRSGKHLLALINDILEMSKLEADRISLNPTQFDLFQGLDYVQDLLSTKIKSKGLKFEVERDPNLPQWIIADENKFRQILLNCLGHLMTWTEAGTLCLRVKALLPNSEVLMSPSPSNSPPEAIKLEFEIETTVLNQDSLEIKDLFKPFTSVQRSLAFPEAEHLSLPMSQQFLHLMEGTMVMERSSNQGVKLTLVIPVQLGEVQSQDPVSAAGKIIGLSSNQPNYRLLVVEDQIAWRCHLTQFLEQMGFQVREAENGQEGLILQRVWKPHLIVMKMWMPIMSGYEAIQRIRLEECPLDDSPEFRNSETEFEEGLPHQTIILAMIPSGSQEDKQLALSVGFDDFLCIPFPEDELLDKISEYLKVEYQYAPEFLSQRLGSLSLSPPTLSSPLVISPALEIMPPEWVEQLYYAAAQCSDRLLLQLIGQIPPEHEAMAQHLSDLVDNFHFDQVMEWAKQPEDSVRKKQ